MIKLQVMTHSGDNFEVDVEVYDAAALNEQLNSNEINTVAIGDLIISRINVKTIKPLQVEE